MKWRERRQQRREREDARHAALAALELSMVLADTAEKALRDGAPVTCLAVARAREAQREAVAALDAYEKYLA